MKEHCKDVFIVTKSDALTGTARTEEYKSVNVTMAKELTDQKNRPEIAQDVVRITAERHL